jgi:hypothetical protein
MELRVRLTRQRVALAAILVGLVTGGVAYATIPDGNGVFTACKLNATGTIRLIDPSGPSSSLLSRCTSLETQFTFNQKGLNGTQGPPGPQGPKGDPGATGAAGGLSCADEQRIKAAAPTFALSAACVPPAPAAQCADGTDNDGDGLKDYPADPGCTSATDNDEADACADPEAQSSDLGSVSGDTGGASVTRSGSICPGDEDWFALTLTEDHSDPFGGTDLRARITLTMPAGGDLDLCVTSLSVAGTPTQCSTAQGTLTDHISIVVPDTASSNDSRFAIQVRGASAAAANSYTLTIQGNTT